MPPKRSASCTGYRPPQKNHQTQNPLQNSFQNTFQNTFQTPSQTLYPNTFQTPYPNLSQTPYPVPLQSTSFGGLGGLGGFVPLAALAAPAAPAAHAASAAPAKQVTFRRLSGAEVKDSFTFYPELVDLIPFDSTRNTLPTLDDVTRQKAEKLQAAYDGIKVSDELSMWDLFTDKEAWYLSSDDADVMRRIAFPLRHVKHLLEDTSAKPSEKELIAEYYQKKRATAAAAASASASDGAGSDCAHSDVAR